MDIQSQITKLVKQITADKNVVNQFKKDPVKTVQSLINIDIPSEQLNKIIEGINAKIKVDQTKDVLGKAQQFFKK